MEHKTESVEFKAAKERSLKKWKSVLALLEKTHGTAKSGGCSFCEYDSALNYETDPEGVESCSKCPARHICHKYLSEMRFLLVEAINKAREITGAIDTLKEHEEETRACPL